MAAPSHTPLLFLPHLLPHPLESNGAWGSVLGPLPFSIYTHIFRDLIHSRGFMYPPYSDDFLVFVSNAYPDLHTYTANYLQSTYTWKPNRHPNTMSTKTAWCSSLSLLLLQASSFQLISFQVLGPKILESSWMPLFLSHPQRITKKILLTPLSKYSQNCTSQPFCYCTLD